MNKCNYTVKRMFFQIEKGRDYMKKARKGFTLIEVICVLTIIAIIAAIAVPGISGYIDKSKKNNCRTVMQNFVNDLEYRIVSRRYYDINELTGKLYNRSRR